MPVIGCGSQTGQGFAPAHGGSVKQLDFINIEGMRLIIINGLGKENFFDAGKIERAGRPGKGRKGDFDLAPGAGGEVEGRITRVLISVEGRISY